MANVLPAKRRLEVLAALVNGTSVRAAERMTGVHRDTIGRFAQAIGEGCARIHDRIVRDLTCPFVDLDEMHSWCGRRQIHVDPAKPEGPARALPSGRGWLRVVGGGSTGTTPGPQPPPTAPSAVVAPVEAAPEHAHCQGVHIPSGAKPTGQLDLFAWRPKPRPSMQLSLFGEPPDGAE